MFQSWKYPCLRSSLLLSQFSHHPHDKQWPHNKYPGSTEFPHSSVGKESACNAGDLGSIPRSGRSPGEGNDNPLQDSCLGNPMDRGAWWVTVYGVARVGHDLATKHTHTHTHIEGSVSTIISHWVPTMCCMPQIEIKEPKGQKSLVSIPCTKVLSVTCTSEQGRCWAIHL